MALLTLAACVVAEPMPEAFDDDDVTVDDDDVTPTSADDDDGAYVIDPDCNNSDYDWGQGGEWMVPGSACLRCHSEGGHAQSVFAVGGTLFVRRTCPEPIADAVVHIQDADLRWFRLRTNEVGNFWTTDEPRLPVRIAIEVDGELTWKPGLQPFLDCNSCHALDGQAGLMAPVPR